MISYLDYYLCLIFLIIKFSSFLLNPENLKKGGNYKIIVS
jgi:hypothetical protein